MPSRRDLALTPVNCRARVHDNCLHGKKRKHWREDGTYDYGGDSIVCDPCYVTVMPYTPSGQGLNEELPEAIRTVRRLRNGQ